jgi:hypothetical protein
LLRALRGEYPDLVWALEENAEWRRGAEGAERRREKTQDEERRGKEKKGEEGEERRESRREQEKARESGRERERAGEVIFTKASGRGASASSRVWGAGSGSCCFEGWCALVVVLAHDALKDGMTL